MVQRIDTGIVDSVSRDGELIYKVQLRSGLLLEIPERLVSPPPKLIVELGGSESARRCS